MGRAGPKSAGALTNQLAVKDVVHEGRCNFRTTGILAKEEEGLVLLWQGGAISEMNVGQG